MPDIVISGSLTEVLAKLRRIKSVIENRVAVGYSSRLHEFEYRYNTVQDNGVCPNCTPLNGNLFRADYIESEFSYSVSVDTETVMVHNQTYYHVHDRCRCTLTMTNKYEAVVYLLYMELMNA